MAQMSDDEKQQTWQEFKTAVNMAPKELEDWLKTDTSKSVGWTHEGDSESVGHDSGRKIVTIKHTKKDDLSDADYQHMRKVCGYVARHIKQKPQGDVENTNWRYSLMNWGHDPLKS